MASSCRRARAPLIIVATLLTACGTNAIPSTESTAADTARAEATDTAEPTPTPRPAAEPSTIPEPAATATPAATASPAPTEPPNNTDPPPPPTADIPPLAEFCAQGLGEEETVELDPNELVATSPEEALERHRPNEMFLQGVDLQPGERSQTRATWDIILPDGTIGGHLYFEAFDGLWAYVGADFCP